jgi:hypothetical protein
MLSVVNNFHIPAMLLSGRHALREVYVRGSIRIKEGGEKHKS